MTLTLHIENETSLPDGGPMSVSIKGKRGLDIGRDPYLDWTLPDPSRFISGRHCEVRWHDGGYWLHDISTNGTFMDGSDSRLKQPHRLRNGDRFVIGQYVIAAALEEDPAELNAAQACEAASSHGPPGPPADENLWDAAPSAAPIDPKQLKAPRDLAPARPDFLDWAVAMPAPIPNHASPLAAPVSSAGGKPVAVGVEPDAWVTGPSPISVSPPPAAVLPARSNSVAPDLGPDGWAAEPAPPPPRPTSPPPPAAPRAEIIPAPPPRPPDVAQAKGSPAVAEFAAPASLPETPEAGADHSAMATFAQLIARGANLPNDAFAKRDPGELAEQLGRVLKLATDNMKQLLEARQQAKRLVRSSNQTVIQAIDNNPLKFAPTAEDALRIMFGPKSQGYLNAEKAFTQGFDDLKKHQIRTYAAMQQAVTLLMKDVEPAAIESASDSDRGLAAVVGSRKARLWDIYVARWQASAKRGILDTFMAYFARCYEDE